MIQIFRSGVEIHHFFFCPHDSNSGGLDGDLDSIFDAMRGGPNFGENDTSPFKINDTDGVPSAIKNASVVNEGAPFNPFDINNVSEKDDQSDVIFKNLFNSDEEEHVNLNDILFSGQFESGEVVEVDPKIFEDSVPEGVNLFEQIRQESSPFDIFNRALEENMNERPILNTARSSLKEETQETPKEGNPTLKTLHQTVREEVEERHEYSEFDLDEYLSNVLEELETKVYRFNSIRQMIVTSPKEHAFKFLKTTIQDKLESFGETLQIEQLVQPPSDEPSILALFELFNLQANLKKVEPRREQFKETLNKHNDSVMSSILEDRDKALEMIQQNKPSLEQELSSRYAQDNSKLTSDEQQLLNLIKKAESLSVESAIQENEELFEETEETALVINDLKERIIEVLGKRFIQDSRQTFEIPRSREELEDLIDEVYEIANKAETNSLTVYDKVGFRLLRLLYTPVRYTEGQFRMLVSLVTTAVYMIIAVNFKALVVGAFALSAVYDLFQQAKLASKNGDMRLLSDFVKNSDRIINDLRDSIAHEAIELTKTESQPYYEAVREHFQKSRDELIELYETKLDEISNINDNEKIIELINVHFSKLKTQMVSTIETIYIDYANSLTEFSKQVEGKISTAEEEIRQFPNTDIYEDANYGNTVYKNNYKVARITLPDSDMGIDFERQFVEGSYLVKCKGNDERNKIANFVKLLIMQQQTHLKPGHAVLNVFDIEQAGSLFMDMASEEDELFNLYSREDEMDKKVEDMYYEISKRHNVVLKRFNSVTEYNIDAPNSYAKPYSYYFNFWYNVPKEIASKTAFRSIIKEGQRAGMINIFIMDENEFVDKKGAVEDDLIYDYNATFDYIVSKDFQGTWILKHNKESITKPGPIFHQIPRLSTSLISYDKEKVRLKAENLDKFLADTKTTVFFYQDLEQRYSEKLFTKDTLTGIDICVGFRDGDINKPEFVRLDDELVHCLMAGKTGAGKSNTINVVLLNLLRNYSPEWLELYMVDFKNVEFNFYTEEKMVGDTLQKFSLVPHTSLLAGTTDPEYAFSVFRNAIKEMERRKKLLSKGINGRVFKKIETYNKFILKNNLRGEVKILPRILILLDEFQVMFKMEDQDKLQKIKDIIERLSREARSMGIHMFFTSQSMDGTLKDDVKQQFAMRFCLSASSDTSKSVLGNDASSKLKGKGFIYMSGTQERAPEDNRLFKVPLLEEEYNKQNLMDIRDACLELNKRNPYIPFHGISFYDESARHTEPELTSWLNHDAVKKERDLLLLGPPVIFQGYTNPENTIIGNADGDNILLTGNDKLALANMVNTLTANFSSKERSRVIILNCDRNMDGMFKEQYLDKDYIQWLNTSDILPFLDDINYSIVGPSTVDEDANQGPSAMDKFNAIFGDNTVEDDEDDYVPPRFNPEVDSRYYVIIVGLHKAVGFNEDYVEDKYMQELLHMLKYGPIQGVTTIVNYKTPFKARKILPQFTHRISTRVDEDISFDAFSGRQASKLFSEDNLNFGLYKNYINGEEYRFKVFEFEYDKSLMASKRLKGIALVV